MFLRDLVFILFLLSWSLLFVSAQGNVTCKSTSLDWYTSVVGETPCQTYQRLRQICNPAYTVNSLRTATPPDYCDDQLKNCCCNSISFALSMLCLNCQQGVGSGVNGDTGYDAGAGAYQLYLSQGGGSTCSPNTNQSFPRDIQAAVCNKNIKIEDELYQLFWNDGAWYYIYTSQAISKDHATYNNNTFTHCASTTVTNTTLLSTATSSQPSSSSQTTSSTGSVTASSTSLSGGAIGGIAAAGAILLLALGFIFRLFWKRGKAVQYDTVHPNETMSHRVEPFSPPTTHSLPTSADASYTGPLTAPLNQSSKMRPVSQSYSQSQAQPHSNANGDSNGPPSTATASTSPLTDRHLDAGPLSDVMLQRSPSGRLPPAYGEQHS